MSTTNLESPETLASTGGKPESFSGSTSLASLSSFSFFFRESSSLCSSSNCGLSRLLSGDFSSSEISTGFSTGIDTSALEGDRLVVDGLNTSFVAGSMISIASGSTWVESAVEVGRAEGGVSTSIASSSRTSSSSSSISRTSLFASR